jgi:fructose transport system substrate-binding protein
MASLGVDAVAKYAKDKTKPTTSSGLDFYNTGVSLVTDDPQAGVDGIDSTKGLSECWGTKA